MSVALGNGESKPAAAARSSHSDDSEEYASYRKMLDGFVTGLDDMLSDWCAKNSPSGTPVGTVSAGERSSPGISSQLSAAGMNPSPSSSHGSLDDFVADASADIGRDDSGSDDDVIDGTEDYNAPSIAENYNFHSLRRTEEVTTVERLHASSELWFYPTLSRADALRMLENKEVGVFMVRNSSKPGNFALSMRQESPDPYIQHYLIQQTLEGLQVQGAEHFFDSLEELIAHYCDYISGGMPTNLVLPICAAEPATRSELFAEMEKESTMLKLLEMSVLKPATLMPSQVSCLQAGLVEMRQDTTRVCPPRASFRWSVRMPMIQSVFVPTPQTPLTCPPGSMSLARGVDASQPDLPPALPPKRRSATLAAQEVAHLKSSADKWPVHQAADRPLGIHSDDTPPPLPPKQRATMSRAADSHAAAQGGALQGRRMPPPIPRRGIFPGTLPEEADDDEDALSPSRRPSATQRRHTLSSVDRQSLTRTRSNGSDAGKEANRNEAKDEDGYLLPCEVSQLADSHRQRQKQQQRASSGARLASTSSTSRTSGTSVESHSYIDIDLIVGLEPAPNDARAPPPPGVPTTERNGVAVVAEDAPHEDDAQHEGGASPSQRSTVKAQRVLGMDEPEPRRSSAPKVNPSTWIKNRAANISVMSRFGKTATERVVISISKYAASKNTVLGQNIDMFLTTANSKPHDDNPIKFAEMIRGFMNSLKNYLLGPGRTELNEIISRSYALAGGEEINIQLILERALHKAVLKPLKSLIYKSFIDNMSRSGSLSNLRNALKAGKQMSRKDLGIRERLIPPQGPSLHQIGQHLIKMQKAFSPTTKIQHMLAAVQAIYKSVKDTQSEIANEQLVMGADDFLPMMVYILCQLEVWKMEVETEYLWALLDESQKVGEGGYYLTTISGAVRAIGILASQPSASPEPPAPWASTKPKTQASAAINTPSSAKSSDTATSAGSSSSSNSGGGGGAARKMSEDIAATASVVAQGQAVALSTSPLSMVSPTTGDIRLPCMADMQGFMRIHIDNAAGKTLSVHTLPVTVYTTVADTCRMVAKKFDIKEPELFGLFQVTGQTASLLRDDEKPQVIKAEWLADNGAYGQLNPGVERYFGYRLRQA